MADEAPQTPAPVFGLKAEYRPYECTCCGHKEAISTNHTDLCFNYCTGCSWTCSKYPAMIMGAHYYRAFVYDGPAVSPNEIIKTEEPNKE